MIGENENMVPMNVHESLVQEDQFVTPLSCSTIPPEDLPSQSRFQVEYLKLEVVELKELLIALASKYKMCEDKRRHLDQRNALLLQENVHLNTMANVAERERADAVEENRATLAKLKEFLTFKDEFQRQAMELRKALKKRPKQKSKSTSITELISSGASGDASESRPVAKEDKDSQTEKEECLSRPSSASSASSSAHISEHRNDSVPPTSVAARSHQPKDQARVEKKSGKKQNGQSKLIPSIWKDRVEEAVSSASAVKNKLLKANHEIQTLRNLNDWKSTQLEQKGCDLQRKKDELVVAHKEIVKLRGVINKLNSEQAANRYGVKKFTNVHGRCKQTLEKTKECNKTNSVSRPQTRGRIQPELEVKIVPDEKPEEDTKLVVNKTMQFATFGVILNSDLSPGNSPQGSEEQLQRLWYLDPVKERKMEHTACLTQVACD